MIKTKITVLALAIAALAILDAAAAGRDSIRVHRSASVASGAIRLGDLADVRVGDAELKDRLMGLVVGRLEGEAESGTLDVFEIRRALHLANVEHGQVDVFGATQCRLTVTDDALGGGDSVEMPGDSVQNEGDDQSVEPRDCWSVADEVSRIISRSSGIEHEKLLIEWSGRSGRELLESPFDPNHLTIIPRSTMQLGRVNFEVFDNRGRASGNAEGKDGGKSLICADVQYLCESVVACRSLRAGQEITADDVRLLPRRVSRLADVGISDETLVVGQQAARSVSADTVITAAMIKKICLVKRRSPVTVYSRIGEVEIVSRGEALGDGGLGDVIGVCYGPGKIMIRARITGAGKVAVGEADDRGQAASGEAGGVAVVELLALEK